MLLPAHMSGMLAATFERLLEICKCYRDSKNSPQVPQGCQGIVPAAHMQRI